MKDDLRNDLRNVGGFLGWLLGPPLVITAVALLLGADRFDLLVVGGFAAVFVVAMVRQR